MSDQASLSPLSAIANIDHHSPSQFITITPLLYLHYHPITITPIHHHYHLHYTHTPTAEDLDMHFCTETFADPPGNPLGALWHHHHFAGSHMALAQNLVVFAGESIHFGAILKRSHEEGLITWTFDHAMGDGHPVVPTSLDHDERNMTHPHERISMIWDASQAKTTRSFLRIHWYSIRLASQNPAILVSTTILSHGMGTGTAGRPKSTSHELIRVCMAHQKEATS